jgi:hypothetical protein
MGFYLLDAQPIVQWEKLYGGSGDDFIRHIHATPDGGCITAGTSTSTEGDVGVNFGDSDAWIMKLDQNGLLEWKKVLGGDQYDTGQCIFNTSDGNYIFLGSTISSNGGAIEIKGEGDFWIVKLDLSGNILWQKTYGGSAFDLLRKGKPTSDGGFIVTGDSESNDGDVSGHHGTVDFDDVWVGKFDSLGQLEWQQSLGGMKDDYGYEISGTQDGGYVIAAYILSPDVPGFHGVSEGWVIKLNSDGEVEWQRTLGGSNDDGLYAVEGLCCMNLVGSQIFPIPFRPQATFTDLGAAI